MTFGMTRSPAPPLPLNEKERRALEEIAGSVSLAYRAVREAKGLLMAADGVANTTIAIELGVSRSTVLQWREHFELDGVEWVGKVREGRTGVFQQPWTQWGQMVGAVWSDAEPKTGHAQRHAYEVKWQDARHPISAGLPAAFTISDELYH